MIFFAYKFCEKYDTHPLKYCYVKPMSKNRQEILTEKIRRILEREQANGIVRSDLYRRAVTSGEALQEALDQLLAEKKIVTFTKKPSAGSGRSYQVYVLAEYAEAYQHVLIKRAPILTCEQCGTTMTYTGVGRPPSRCLGCKTSETLLNRNFYARVDPHMQRHIAVLLTLADILSRGYTACLAHAFGIILIYDASTIFQITVCIGTQDGNANAAQYPSAAVVYPNGKIVYCGQIPLVNEDSSDKNTAHATSAPESSGSA